MDVIHIPEAARGQPLSDYSLSARLAHAFEGQGLQRLGDLHGRSFRAFAQLRNCGGVTVRELRMLVQAVQRAYPSPEPCADPASPFLPVVADGFRVPARLREVNVFELPLSSRLHRALVRLGVQRFGELQGVTLREFARLPNCGRHTRDEAIRLIQRAADGEFDVGSEAFTPANCGELVSALDDLLARVPSRDQRILLLRLGAEGGAPSTLGGIGGQFGITRERVRQIVLQAVKYIRTEGGPKLAHQLRGLAATCHDLVCPLTPPLLASWLGQDTSHARLPTVAYVRLLGLLESDIPALAGGDAPPGEPKGYVHRMVAALPEILVSARRGLPLKEVLQRLRTYPKLRRLKAAAFLGSLGWCRDLHLDFTRPDRPTARLHRWSRAAVA